MLLKHIGDRLKDLLNDETAVCAREYADRFLILCERNQSEFERLHNLLVEEIPSHLQISGLPQVQESVQAYFPQIIHIIYSGFRL